ncbi:phage tail tip lysozyme [Rhodopseudomonas pseudopalustris]|uniref:Phage tail lysozyme domain-containing protein n=1 Tax=Rhodopseudomonas pseudopalustris TaxID=1513892 RepID=A0A1H8WJH3_9BRAD|nr:phage tail tip lysozyme [Rhodopseudomonas pseudopalustris]SEP27577.1 hypothetical protein SAMN05444123_112135 [Rhodopseudomonas pseudopalustris]
MADSVQYAMQWLLKRGYQPHQAAALVGHGIQESGLRTDAVGDNGTAKGVFQWRGDRLSGLYNFARETGQDANSLDTQLGYLDRELNTTEKRAGDALRASTDVRSATRAGMMYERPAGYTAANPEAGHGWANRFGKAQELFGGAPAVTADAPASRLLATPAATVWGAPPAAVMSASPFDNLAAAFAGSANREQAEAQAADQQRRKALLGGGLGAMFG